MMFPLFTLATFFSAAMAMVDIPADSKIGQRLLERARRVEEQDFEERYNWITSYSVKFQGCHNIKQWNSEADGEDDVRIATKRLVRFRLCPSDSCSATKGAGCSSAYGDYIIGMDTFMQSYMEGKRSADEWKCANYLQNSCNCDKDNNQADDFNEEYCEYDCFNDAGMAECIERNPYQDEQMEEEEFDLEDYMECSEIKANNQNRRLNNNNQEVKYYVGPYCASQGGAIKLGLFTDDTCTQAAEEVTFYDLMGYNLPYSGEGDSLIGTECLECIEHEDANKQNENDQQDADQVSEMCETIYMGAGKCESNLPSELVSYGANTNACTYMEGIRIVRQDGIIDTGSSRPSAVATAFIVIFAMAFAAMAFYVWYLRTRLGVKKNTLL